VSLTDLSLRSFLDELSAGSETPGGGSALAVTLAVSAAVVEMSARLSAPSWPAAAEVASHASALRARATALVDEIADAYAQALAARGEAATTMTRAERNAEVGRTFAAAAEPPLEIARVAAEVAELAELVAYHGEPHVQPDAAVAAEVAAAAARGGLALVEVNLTAQSSDPRVEEATKLLASAERAAARAVARSG